MAVVSSPAPSGSGALVLAIVGSTCLERSPLAFRAVSEVVDEYVARHPSLVICSGAALGVDRIAAEAARARGATRMTPAGLPRFREQPYGSLWLLEYPPVCRAEGRYGPGHRCTWQDCFRPRDLLVAENCDELVRVAGECSTSYGSGWTRDRAAALGKPVREILIPLSDDELSVLAVEAYAAAAREGGLFPHDDGVAAVKKLLQLRRLADVSVLEAPNLGLATVFRGGLEVVRLDADAGLLQAAGEVRGDE